MKDTFNMRISKELKQRSSEYAKNIGMDLSTLIRVLLLKEMNKDGESNAK